MVAGHPSACPSECRHILRNPCPPSYSTVLVLFIVENNLVLDNEEYPPNGIADKNDRNLFYLEEVTTGRDDYWKR
jgi:hypothetical protein